MAVAKTSKIKLFQSIQKFLNIQGIYPLQSNQSTPYNGKNLFFLFCYVQMFISATAFCLFKAKSMYEFGLTFYASLTELQTIVYFTIILWKVDKVLKLIGNLENFIEKSK